VRRLDALFHKLMPYQMWILQVPDAHLSVTISGLLRDAGRLRILGAAEAATGLSFSPLAPRKSAAALRAVTLSASTPSDLYYDGKYSAPGS
jgi:hypothetical protein